MFKNFFFFFSPQVSVFSPFSLHILLVPYLYLVIINNLLGSDGISNQILYLPHCKNTPYKCPLWVLHY